MAGRDQLISNMRQAFQRNGRDPHLSTLLIGARGTGKTALRHDPQFREEAWKHYRSSIMED